MNQKHDATPPDKQQTDSSDDPDRVSPFENDWSADEDWSPPATDCCRPGDGWQVHCPVVGKMEPGGRSSARKELGPHYALSVSGRIAGPSHHPRRGRPWEVDRALIGGGRPPLPPPRQSFQPAVSFDDSLRVR